MQWLSTFQSSLAREFGDRPAIGVLATVSPERSAAARCVVLRELTDDGQLVLTTDARSEKVEHLASNQSAECVFWLPTLRLQYRVAGRASIDTNLARRQQSWDKLSPATRSTFFGPPPGTVKAESSVQSANDTDLNKAPESVKAVEDSLPPEVFAVLVLIPDRIESLDLMTDPHTRLEYSRQNDGKPVAINP